MRALLMCLMVAGVAPAQNFQVTGTVVDHLSGQPLHRVLVNLISSQKNGGIVSVLTPDNGRFVFTDVPPGKYRLTAQRPGETQQAFRQDPAGFATALIVGPGSPAENLVFPLRANSSIRGQVMDDQGDPVARAQVHLVLQSVINGELQTNMNRSLTTNAAGEFHVGRLVPGTYFVGVTGRPWYSTAGTMPRRPQNTNTDMVYPVTWYGNTTNGEAATPINLTEGAAVNLQIALHAVPSVHVELAANATASGDMSHPAPPQMASVMALGPGGVRVPFFTNVFQESNGKRELMGVPAGRYDVVFNQTNKGEVQQNVPQTLDLVDGTIIPATPESHLSVTGKLTFVDGEKPENEVEVYFNGGNGGAMAAVGEDGTFTVPPSQIRPGSYGVHLNGAAVWIQSMTVKGARQTGERVEFPANGNVVFSIVAAKTDHLASVKGLAMGGEKPVPGAFVLLVPEDVSQTRFMRRNQSDSDGSFDVTGVVAGKYTLVAIDDGAGLLYKAPGVIKPYLAGGVALKISTKPVEDIKVPVQKRLTQ